MKTLDQALQEELKDPEFKAEWNKIQAEKKIMQIIEEAKKKYNKQMDEEEASKTVEAFINLVADLEIEELNIKLA